MRRGILIAAALGIALAVTASIAPVAGAGGPLTLKRKVVVKGHAKIKAKHLVYRTVLRSPGKGVVGTARVRCAENNRCSVRTKFSEGRVNARGEVGRNPNHQALPIVGGTRTFRYATGKLIVRPDPRHSRLFWIYKLESFG